MADPAHVIDDSQRTAAKVAALACLLSYAAVVFAEFGIRQRIMVPGDIARSIQQIAVDERLFRVGVALNVGYAVGVVVLVTALYVILRPVSRHVALLATLWRLTTVVTWVLAVLGTLSVVHLASGADLQRLLQAEPVQGLVRLSGESVGDQYYVGLAFWALASTACSYLWLTSGYIPRLLAGFGLVSSIWCAFCTLACIIAPGFADLVNLWWFDSPMAVFELALSVWLLVKGLPRPEAARG